MPSIEIVSIGQKEPTDLSNFPLAVRSETELLSHRGLFQKNLDRLTGVIYHLGNPRFKTEGVGFFANELLNKDGLYAKKGWFEIGRKYRSDFEYLLDTLLTASPIERVFLLSDYQFGPKKKTRGGEITLVDFWRMNDLQQLKINGAYTISKTSSVQSPTEKS
jgi:hypothetical protein